MIELPSDEYFAGLVDGEANIGLQWTGKNTKQVRPIIQICMTDETIIQLFAKRFNGNVYLVKKGNGWKDQYRTVFTCKKAYPVLSALLPYLIVKKADALKALTYYDKLCVICGTKISPTKNKSTIYCSAQCYKTGSNNLRRSKINN